MDSTLSAYDRGTQMESCIVIGGMVPNCRWMAGTIKRNITLDSSLWRHLQRALQSSFLIRCIARNTPRKRLQKTRRKTLLDSWGRDRRYDKHLPVRLRQACEWCMIPVVSTVAISVFSDCLVRVIAV